MRTFIFLFALLPFRLACQNHDYHWTLGYDNPYGGDTSGVFGGMNIDFNANPPTVYKVNRPMNFKNFCAACSDSTGKLLYYSNGIRIFNWENKLMENGDTINPGSIWENFKDDGYPYGIGGYSIPHPGNPNQYFLFHMAAVVDGGVRGTPFYYTLVDMAQNGGKGKVLQKNQIVLTSDEPNISILVPSFVKHGNGRDWWLLTGIESSNVVLKYNITPEGVLGPFEQTTPLTLSNSTSKNLFSPDGTWYLKANAGDGLELFSFNRCTGELTNHQFLPKVPDYFLTSGSAVFSADSKKLYVSDNRAIVIQFDLSDGILSYSRMDTVQQYDLFSDPGPPFLTRFFFGQLGADGKIYRATSGTTSYMHVTHRPNLPAPLCDLENHGIDLPRYNSNTVCYFPNYRLGVWEGSPCDTIQLQNPPPGFENTSYQEFLEREARFRPHEELPPPDVLERLREQPTRAVENDDPFDPANPKHITIRALAEKGVISQEEAQRMMREE